MSWEPFVLAGMAFVGGFFLGKLHELKNHLETLHQTIKWNREFNEELLRVFEMENENDGQ